LRISRTQAGSTGRYPGPGFAAGDDLLEPVVEPPVQVNRAQQGLATGEPSLHQAVAALVGSDSERNHALRAVNVQLRQCAREAMNKRSRSMLVTTLGVIMALGVLLLAGRLTGDWFQRTADPATVTTRQASPPLPVVLRAAVSDPVDGVTITDDGAVWVVHHGALSRVDPHTLRITATVADQQPVAAVAAGAGAVWASAGKELLRVDPHTAKVAVRLPVATGSAPVAASDTVGVWAVCCGTDGSLGAPRLTRVDPTTNRVAATVPRPGPADAVGAGPAGVWVRSPRGPVWRVDPARNRLAATLQVPGGLGAAAGSVLVDHDVVLVTDPDNGAVYVVDAGRDRFFEGGFEAAGRDVAADDRGIVWVHSDQRLVGFGPDHTRGRTLEEAGGAVRALAAGRDALWVGASAGLFRVDFSGLP